MKRFVLAFIIFFFSSLTAAQDMISFPSQTCLSKTQFLDSCNPVNVTGKFYKASGDALVIVTHNSAGTDERHYRYAEHIQSLGFSALVVDHWKSRGISDAQKNFIEVGKRGGNIHNMVVDVNWAMRHFQSKGFKKFGFIGESMGGGVAMALTKEEWQSTFRRVSGQESVRLDAIVGLYGNCNERYTYDRFLNSPMLMITGDKDTNTPAKTCKDYIEEWATPRGANMRFMSLPGQYHDFDADFKLFMSPSAQNPSRCIATVDIKTIRATLTGKTYANTPDGWNVWKSDCLENNSTTMYGHTGDRRTGFKEWSAFFTLHLGTP